MGSHGGHRRGKRRPETREARGAVNPPSHRLYARRSLVGQRRDGQDDILVLVGAQASPHAQQRDIGGAPAIGRAQAIERQDQRIIDDGCLVAGGRNCGFGRRRACGLVPVAP